MAHAIEEFANKIALAIQGNLVTIPNDLKSKGLLGDEDYGRIVNTQAISPLQRANDLVQCVITQVKIDPTQYQVFYSVLEKYPNLQVLLKILPTPDGGGEQPAESETGSQQPEDTSKPKFAADECESVTKKVNPAILHVHQTDETTMKAVGLFARQVVLILHTCNDNEYWAALERLEPPTAEDGSNIRDRAVKYPGTPSVIGWFAGYRTAVVRTEQGNKCRIELTKALTESFANAQVIIGAGIAYANSRKRKFADVLISDQIENFVQYRKEGDKITNRGPRVEIDPNVQKVFKKPAGDWTSIRPFRCADNDRPSKAHTGCIVSAPTLVRDEVLKEQLMKHTPDCIGGEMEGWVLLEMKRELFFQYKKNVEVIVIKSVADYGDRKKGDDWQWTAAKAAMDCIHYCLETTGGSEFSAIDIEVKEQKKN